MSKVKFVDMRTTEAPRMLSTGDVVEAVDGLFMKTSYSTKEDEHLICLVSYSGKHTRGVRYPIANSEFRKLTPIDIAIIAEDKDAVDM